MPLPIMVLEGAADPRRTLQKLGAAVQGDVPSGELVVLLELLEFVAEIVHIHPEVHQGPEDEFQLGAD